MEVPKLHAREPGPNYNVCLCVYAYIHCTFMHGHAVVGSDKKLVNGMIEGKLLSNRRALDRKESNNSITCRTILIYYCSNLNIIYNLSVH